MKTVNNISCSSSLLYIQIYINGHTDVCPVFYYFILFSGAVAVCFFLQNLYFESVLASLLPLLILTLSKTLFCTKKKTVEENFSGS